MLLPWKPALWRCCLMAFLGDGQTEKIHLQNADCSFRGLGERGSEGIAMKEAWIGLWGFNEAVGEIRNRRWETQRAQSAAVGDFIALLHFVSAFSFFFSSATKKWWNVSTWNKYHRWSGVSVSVSAGGMAFVSYVPLIFCEEVLAYGWVCSSEGVIGTVKYGFQS